MLKNFLLLSGFSTFVVIIIVGFNIYHNLQVSSLPALTLKRIDQIPSNFDTNTLNKLKKRVPITADLREKSSVKSEDTQANNTSIPKPTPPGTEQDASASAKPTITVTKTPLIP